MDKLDLLKSHIDQFTRSDGSVVAAHDDKRMKAAPKPAAKPATPAFEPPKDEWKYHGPDEKPGDFHGRMKAYHEMLASGAKNEIAKKSHETHAAYHAAGQEYYKNLKPSAVPAPGEVGHEEYKAHGKYFKKGEKVRNQYNRPVTVVSHSGSVVTTDDGNFHPSNLTR